MKGDEGLKFVFQPQNPVFIGIPCEQMKGEGVFVFHFL